MNDEEKLIGACLNQEWNDAKDMITKKPQLVWTARDEYGCTPAFLAAASSNVEMLQHMLTVILRQPFHGDEERRRILRDAFERGAITGVTPAHNAARWGHVQCLAFLVEHAPSGGAVLEVKNKDGDTPAYFAAYWGHVNVLEFIVKNAPSGVGVLQVKDNFGKTPLDLASKNVKAYFTPQKIREIGLERELKLLRAHVNSGPFASLVFTIVKETSELKLQGAQNNL